MKYYKVVREEDGKRYSLIVHGKACVEYVPGEWTKAPEWLARRGYHLLVFTDFDKARYWCENETDEVWECEVKDVIEELPLMLDIKALACGRAFNSFSCFPKETVMAREVKLVKLVHKGPCMEK